ncbi:MAG: T9SS type A sorting domain-containing protein [Bacteroidetes bacterium]|nr:T9SS type A sorting domain-containing protein [Bacteroidota bacterium]
MKTKLTLSIVLFALFFFQTNAQWSLVSSGVSQNLISVAFSGNKGLIGGNSGKILHSSDAGITWDDSSYYNYDPIYGVAYSSSSVAVAGTAYKFYTSTNSGNTFAGPYSLSGFNTFRDITFANGTNGYAIDDFCKLATSTDGGQNWTTGGNPCGNLSEMRDIDFPTATVGYMCGHNGNVFKTIDGGTLWTHVTVSSVTSVNYKAIQFLDANTGFIAGKTTSGQDTMVFKKTTDGGTSWTNMKQGLIDAGCPYNADIPSFSFLNQNDGYLANENKIYKTTDGGTTWTLDFTSTFGGGSSTFTKILASSNVVMAVGGQGLAARLGLGSVGINEVNAPQQIKVYPNPSTQTITLGTFLVKNENAFVSIKDISGKIVKAEKLTTNEIDIARLGKGIYFGTLTGNKDSKYTFRFVKE